ncbi:glycosyltransferase family 4 protein [Candidatus Parcubacteria bacterium]|nr:glycosyltransferase family 4 protein [Candidatus Parcubacteria bacterium]
MNSIRNLNSKIVEEKVASKISNGVKILSISLDNSVLNKKSVLAKRTIEYGNLAEKYTVIALSKESKKIILSEQVSAIGVGAHDRIFALFKIYKIAKRLLYRNKYDIITVQDQYYLALLSWLLAKKFSIGLEIQVHGFEKYYGLRKLIAKFVIQRADTIRTVSQRLKKQLVDGFGIKEDKITVVPIYVDADDMDKMRLPRRSAPRNDKFVFLTVGRLVPVKNIEMQIRAMASVVKKLKSEKFKVRDVKLWIIGEGNEKGNLKLEITRLSLARQGNLGLDKNVKFFGWQDDLEKFYRQADAFLLTSNSEGWGMAVIEAASYGLPIIMTDVGCAGEVIKDGESGIVVPAGDQKKLEEAMIKLIKNSELRETLRKNAQQEVLRLPNKEETMALYKKSWEKALIKTK